MVMLLAISQLLSSRAREIPKKSMVHTVHRLKIDVARKPRPYECLCVCHLRLGPNIFFTISVAIGFTHCKHLWQNIFSYSEKLYGQSNTWLRARSCSDLTRSQTFEWTRPSTLVTVPDSIVMESWLIHDGSAHWRISPEAIFRRGSL